MIYDLSNNTFATLYDQPTKAVQPANHGRQAGPLVPQPVRRWHPGSGRVNPAQPTGVNFLRTLGWANTMQAFGDDLYVASGYFGLNHMSLNSSCGHAGQLI